MTLPKPLPENEMEYLLDVKWVSRHFRVDERTAQSWFRTKRLKGFRLPPDDGDLTIPAHQRKSTIYTTKQWVLAFAARYYNLE